LELPVKQDMVELEAPTDWESMKGEYSVLSLFPGGHIMAKLRASLNIKGLKSSRDIEGFADGARVVTAGLVIRRQRPLGHAVFITLEDEFGHIPCMVFPQIYDSNEYQFKAPFLLVSGQVTRREGTCNVVINTVKALKVPDKMEKIPQSKDWH
jgi:error-prone DNA polymerase